MHLEVFVGAITKELRAARPKSVSPAMNCSGVEVVVCLKWIVDMLAPCLG
jgi:hypothetical protein